MTTFQVESLQYEVEKMVAGWPIWIKKMVLEILLREGVGKK